MRSMHRFPTGILALAVALLLPLGGGGTGCRRAPTPEASTYELLARERALRGDLVKALEARWTAVVQAKTAMPNDLVVKEQAFKKVDAERIKAHDAIDKDLVEARTQLLLRKAWLEAAIESMSLHRTRAGFGPKGAVKFKTCGDDGCGGSCGECSADEMCYDGYCRCLPRCEGKACGPDGCGGWCGGCEIGDACDPRTFKCVARPADKAKIAHELCKLDEGDGCAPPFGRPPPKPAKAVLDEAKSEADKAAADKAAADKAAAAPTGPKDPVRSFTVRERLTLLKKVFNFGPIAERSERIDEDGLAAWLAFLTAELARLERQKSGSDALAAAATAAQDAAAKASDARAAAEARLKEVKADPDASKTAAQAVASAKEAEAAAKKAAAAAKDAVTKAARNLPQLLVRIRRVQAEIALYTSFGKRLEEGRTRIQEARAQLKKVAEETSARRQAWDTAHEAQYKPAEDAYNAAKKPVIELASIPTGTAGEATWPAGADYGQAGPQSLRPEREKAFEKAVEALEKYLVERRAAWEKIPDTQKSRATETRAWSDDDSDDDRAFYLALRDWPKLDRMLEEWIAEARGLIASNHRIKTLWKDLGNQYGD